MSITPDKEDIYITINITEGPRYTVSDVRLAGDLPVPGPELRRLVQIRPGDVFSRERLQASAKAISDRLGTEGYAFANVNAVPELDREKQQAAFTFYVDPGRRVYVRKINISGNVKTRDEVIRREMRQLEGAWYDGARIERSKVRIKRLGYFDDVNIETPPVPGTTDQADVDVTVTEKTHRNAARGRRLLERGRVRVQRVGLAAEHLRQRQRADRRDQHEQDQPRRSRCRSPSRTGRSTACRARWSSTSGTSTRPRSRSRSTRRRRAGAAIGFGVPITETDTINLGFRSEHTQLTLYAEQPAGVHPLRRPVRQHDGQLVVDRRLVA